MQPDYSTLAAWDQRYHWHPFTPMREWESTEPTMIVRGEGAMIYDAHGRGYLDGNSSIWTNVHGHAHPRLNAALTEQLGKIAHCSALGLANEVAPALARQLVETLQPGCGHRCFFSDDGATAIETAIKMAWQARQQRGERQRVRFLSLSGGYHGDTVGAMSVGRVPVFHQTYAGLLYPTRQVRMPDSYGWPDPGREPVRGRSSWPECRGEAALHELERVLDEEAETAVALVMEPRVAGVAGFVFHPPGYLRRVAELCRERGIWLILDEVMTGFGRTGALFACHLEGVVPDFLALAKGLTGGYLPLAATLAAEHIYEAFLGDYAEGKTFYHGHSYTANPLGCAAALASLALFEEERTLARVRELEGWLQEALGALWAHPHVGDVRVQGGLGVVELVEDFAARRPFPAARRLGAQVCLAARRHGLMTRPIGDVILLMPPFCVTREQLFGAVAALRQALAEVLPPGR